MVRKIAALLMVATYGSCMEMRETVERTVMVRTTGSDLQPAATGYIYKKESDSPASVTKMGATEVIQHFSKLYGKPEAYKAPAAADSFYDHQEDEDKDASITTQELVKPVVEIEHRDDHVDEHVDGLADEKYDDMFKEYAKQSEDWKHDFADYLHGVGHFDHGIYHGYGAEDGKYYGTEGYKDYGEKGYGGHGFHKDFDKGAAGHYLKKHYGGYSASKGGGHKSGHDEADEHGKHYAHGHGYKGGDHGYKTGHSKGEAVDGFHKVFDKDEVAKDHDFYDGEDVKGEHHKYADGHASHGSNAGGFKKETSHESGHHKGGFGKGGYVDKESGDEHGAEHSSEEGGESGHHTHGDFGVKGEHYDGKGYGYEIKH